jgi:chromosome segregation ATPase
VRIPRTERRLLRIADERTALWEEETRLEAEVEEHRRLHHEARLDALDGDAADRAAFREIEGDLARFERSLARVRQKIAQLDERRRELLARLPED